MDIMIAGAGTVGHSLAQTLSFQHNVTVIDKDIQKLTMLEEEIDILVVQGDSEDPKTYRSLNVDHVDLFIAVTDSDEANLLSTLIIEDEITVSKKIIRLKNDAFLKSHILEKLSIDYAVFPDVTTANKVKALFTFPKANNVKMFHQTKHKLISIRVQYENEVLLHVGQFITEKVIIVGIERDKEFFVPTMETSIFQNDLVYLFGSIEAIEPIAFRLDEKMPASIRKIVIFGANTLAQKIAKALLDKNLEIKMIEKDIDHCKTASKLLQGKNLRFYDNPFSGHPKPSPKTGLKSVSKKASIHLFGIDNTHQFFGGCFALKKGLNTAVHQPPVTLCPGGLANLHFGGLGNDLPADVIIGYEELENREPAGESAVVTHSTPNTLVKGRVSQCFFG